MAEQYRGEKDRWPRKLCSGALREAMEICKFVLTEGCGGMEVVNRKTALRKLHWSVF